MAEKWKTGDRISLAHINELEEKAAAYDDLLAQSSEFKMKAAAYDELMEEKKVKQEESLSASEQKPEDTGGKPGKKSK